jgi:hypothetical protein
MSLNLQEILAALAAGKILIDPKGNKYKIGGGHLIMAPPGRVVEEPTIRYLHSLPGMKLRIDNGLVAWDLALAHLKLGSSARRRSWVPTAHIFISDKTIMFHYGTADTVPRTLVPYIYDLEATDWELL